jgi:hypothetical protein
MEMLYHTTIPLMAMTMSWNTVYSTTSVLPDQHLYRPSKNLYKHAGRTMREVFVYYKHGFLWFGIVLVYLIRNPLKMTYLILHNMIVEDKVDLDLEYNFDNVGSCAIPARNLDRVLSFLET